MGFEEGKQKGMESRCESCYDSGLRDSGLRLISCTKEVSEASKKLMAAEDYVLGLRSGYSQGFARGFNEGIVCMKEALMNVKEMAERAREDDPNKRQRF